jgi:hypothetical protein
MTIKSKRKSDADFSNLIKETNVIHVWYRVSWFENENMALARIFKFRHFVAQAHGGEPALYLPTVCFCNVRPRSGQVSIPCAKKKRRDSVPDDTDWQVADVTFSC